MPFNMEYFRKMAEKKKQEELEKRQDKPVEASEEVMKASGKENSGYYNFHKNEVKNPHYFLCEEVLTPRVNNCDTMRVNMFSNHINQLVHIKTPEFPKVFTNFENQVGEYSIAYKKAEDTFEVISKIVKNKYNYDLIVQYKSTGVYDIIHFNHARIITETYGYTLNDCIPDVQVGDTVKKGEFLNRSDNYDADGNFAYGINLRAVYTPFHNLTYEDGVVISKSAAEKLKSYKVEKKLISINGNDVLLNLYGDEYNYKSFPKVGDEIHSKILVASRRKDRNSILYDYQEARMRKVDPIDDDIIYTEGGTVVDIDIFNNISLADLSKKTDVFNIEIKKTLEDQYRYWRELATELEKIIPCKILSDVEKDTERKEFGCVIKHPLEREKNPNKYTDELSYYWKLAHENCDERIQWRHDGKSFDNLKIQFTILKENQLTEGCKVSGRYGNKGIVAQVIDDSEMPTTEDGVSAEIVLNPLGIINRLNPAQLQEQYINFMSDHVIKEMKETEDMNKKADIFFTYLKALNKKEYDYFEVEYLSMNRSQKETFLQDVEDRGIYIHQAPMFDNTTTEQFETILKQHPDWCTPYNFNDIERPLVMGDIYFIRLKHENSNKFSVRSASNLNVKNLPSKSTLKKEGRIAYANTPIRLGEMEVANLLLSKKPEVVEKMLKTYSTNEKSREETIMQLLSPGRLEDGRLRNTLNMNLNVNPKENMSISRDILEKYFNVLGYSIVDTIDDSKDE